MYAILTLGIQTCQPHPRSVIQIGRWIMTCTTNSSRPPRITGLVQALAVVIGIPVAVLATAMGSRAIEAAYAEKHQAPVTCSVKNMTVTTVTKNGTVPGTTRQPEMTCDLTSLPGVPQRGTQYSENGHAADCVWHSFTELAT